MPSRSAFSTPAPKLTDSLLVGGEASIGIGTAGSISVWKGSLLPIVPGLSRDGTSSSPKWKAVRKKRSRAEQIRVESVLCAGVSDRCSGSDCYPDYDLGKRFGRLEAYAL